MPFWQMGSHQDIVRHFNSCVHAMLFDWPASYCSPEHISQPSHTARLWCNFGCTSRKILNTTDICLTAACGQMRAEFMRTRGSRALPNCAACRNRPAELRGSLYAAGLTQSGVVYFRARTHRSQRQFVRLPPVWYLLHFP